ncbi:hypothetical protein BGZ60DRAFT_528567 [Tricladium varicosporioides]|nr:hypothetical protein BGZ60DRAFT_528567 [Hymenoscyphus varicosporioides]
MSSKQEYTPLPVLAGSKSHEDEPLDKSEWEDIDIDQRRLGRTPRLSYVLIFICGIFVGVVGSFAFPPLVYTIFNALQKAHQTQSLARPEKAIDVNGDPISTGPRDYDPICGSNRHEAKAAGCIFDLLATRWYTPECYHREVLGEMLLEIDFDLWLDPEKTQQAPHDMAFAGDWDYLWPTPDFHIIHCIYQWRRLHRAMLEHRAIDDDVFSYDHTLHCTRMLLNWPNDIKYGKNTTTIIDSRVSYCKPGVLGG